MAVLFIVFFFFFNDTATTEIYTLSLHDALPICPRRATCRWRRKPISSPTRSASSTPRSPRAVSRPDRKSTRLNSSHSQISYAVFCLKKKKKKKHYYKTLPHNYLRKLPHYRNIAE